MADQQTVSTGLDGEGACGRAPLVDAITTFLTHERAPAVSELRESLELVIDEAGPDALACLSNSLSSAGTDWRYYPRDPLARRIHHVLADRVLEQEPLLLGAEHLAAVAGEPLVILANHLSYVDANVLEVVFQRSGAHRLADRLTVVAGPKVYSSVKRRFSSLCFGTIRVPQSSGRATDEAVMNVRDVARGARRAIQIAHERLRLGEALLIFAEGTRSRSGEMQPLLSAVARYLECPGAWVLPVALIGTERLFPVGGNSLSPVQIVVRAGRPFRARALRAGARASRRLMMDAAGLAIAELLPREYRGAYADGLEAARQVLNALR